MPTQNKQGLDSTPERIMLSAGPEEAFYFIIFVISLGDRHQIQQTIQYISLMASYLPHLRLLALIHMLKDNHPLCSQLMTVNSMFYVLTYSVQACSCPVVFRCSQKLEEHHISLSLYEHFACVFV